jgi:DNA-binding transcriptional regulator PaaX
MFVLERNEFIVGLTRKSKRFLEILMLSGFDALTLAAHPKALIYNAVGWTNNRNATRHISVLQEKGYVSVIKDSESGSWVTRLTELGKDTTLGEIEPENSWNKDWNGQWISFSFDLPQFAHRERRHLRAWLKKRRFGRLQGSLWLSHREYASWTEEIEAENIDPRALLFQVVTPIGRQTSREYVAKAWSFTEINRRYAEHLRFLENGIPGPGEKNDSWFEMESNLWAAAFELDPFLPNEILPKDYLGIKSWKLRKKIYSDWAKSTLALPQT